MIMTKEMENDRGKDITERFGKKVFSITSKWGRDKWQEEIERMITDQ